MENPTQTRIVPEGTRLGWSDAGYSPLGLLGQTVMVNSTPTDEPGNGDVAFIARLLRVVTVERRGAEWSIALVFAGGRRVSVPLGPCRFLRPCIEPGCPVLIRKGSRCRKQLRKAKPRKRKRSAARDSGSTAERFRREVLAKAGGRCAVRGSTESVHGALSKAPPGGWAQAGRTAPPAPPIRHLA